MDRQSETLLGRRVSWNRGAPQRPFTRHGVVVYDGPPCVGIPPYDTCHWNSMEDWTLTSQSGNCLFSETRGLIVKVDRVHAITGAQMIPWFYAPSREELEENPADAV